MRSAIVSMIVAAALLSLAAPAAADNLAEMAGKLPPPSLSSNKSMPALEYCVGMGLAQWLTPITLHGDGKVLIAGDPAIPGSQAVYVVVQITDAGDQRMIAFAAHKAWHGKAEALIRSCA